MSLRKRTPKIPRSNMSDAPPDVVAPPSKRSAWLLLAIASGACAAFNGVFAKLTTTSLTSTWATSISQLFGLSNPSPVIEVIIRASFFGLNLLFNAIMWGLFTRALTLATSTVRVSVINTSANFVVTAIAGWVVFSESLPGLWWVGAAMLVGGSVIIGAREGSEGDGAGKGVASAEVGVPLAGTDSVGEERFRDEDEDERARQELRSTQDKNIHRDESTDAWADNPVGSR